MYRALQLQKSVIPVYCFDVRQFGKTSFGFLKTGSFRAKFLRESVADLRRSLQQLGSDLIVRQGLPEQIVPELAAQLGVTSVYFHSEVTAEELKVETSLEKALKALSIKVEKFWGATLYHPDNLPFSISEIPELFTSFRKEVEKKSSVNSTFPTPNRLPKLPEIELGEIPKLSDLGLEEPKLDSRSVLNFVGGETTGLARLKSYFWESDRLKVYKETRNGMLGEDYSSKFSAWLALGCISPRYVYEEVQKYEENVIQNDSTYWLVFELLWRDYFRFICAKHSNKIFDIRGLQGIHIPWKKDWDLFNVWREGKTGFPLVDANMREIATTGFMSNRGRQNVASFLTKNLGINWQMGAEWFESLLIDYDVCSNWGNWNYTAGVGNDARGFRYFNIIKQSKDYDSQGEYIKHWLPELARIPGAKVHEPSKLLPVEQERWHIKLGVDYPCQVVDLWQSAATNDKIYTQSTRKK
jgi:deoxyribodipyrimidine photo-lyase